MQVFRYISVKVLYVLLLFPLIFTGMSSFRPFSGYLCTRVLDGDTVVLERNHQTFRVRLAYIDAPEKKQLSLDGQPIGAWSTKALEKEIINQRVNFKMFHKDMYGRYLGVIYRDIENINLKMISMGMAVVYEKNTTKKYRSFQFQARMRRLGIWQTQGMVNPKIYRRTH